MAMKIVGIANMNAAELNAELQRGGRFVFFQYCVSIVIMTFKRPSNVYFIKAGENSTRKSIGFTLVSLIFGWWGIPWGPIYTVGSLFTNLRGGQDVTDAVVASLNQPAQVAPTAIHAPAA